jgi:hypothetical protein
MDIDGYTNYIIYEDGSCLSKSRNKVHNTETNSKEILLKPRKRGGYMCYALYKDGKPTSFSIHRLVAIHFIPNPNNYRVVHHKDFNADNNCKDNLEWCSDLYNGQSFNKKINNGTVVERIGKKKTSYVGRIRINCINYNTKSVETAVKAQDLINELLIKNKYIY